MVNVNIWIQYSHLNTDLEGRFLYYILSREGLNMYDINTHYIILCKQWFELLAGYSPPLLTAYMSSGGTRYYPFASIIVVDILE